MSWFIRDGLKPLGPFSENEMRHRLLSGELNPDVLIWSDEVREWRPALMWPAFRALSVPAFQEVGTIGDEEAEWIVLHLKTGLTSGPWSLRQVRQGILDGQWTADDCIWKKGMTGWSRIASRPEAIV